MTQKQRMNPRVHSAFKRLERYGDLNSETNQKLFEAIGTIVEEFTDRAMKLIKSRGLKPRPADSWKEYDFYEIQAEDPELHPTRWPQRIWLIERIDGSRALGMKCHGFGMHFGREEFGHTDPVRYFLFAVWIFQSGGAEAWMKKLLQRLVELNQPDTAIPPTK